MRGRQVLVVAAGAAVLMLTGCTGVTPATTTSAKPSTTPVATSPAAAGAVGQWGRAIAVPGLAALDNGKHGRAMSVSCASAGNCAAGGFYTSHGSQGFVISERHGRWGRAIAVPGLAALNRGAGGVEGAYVDSVSCGSVGNCSAGGFYFDQHRHPQGFVVSERNGRWGQAIEVPGLGALNQGGRAFVNSVSCGSAGNCSAGGTYLDQRRHPQGYVVGEWHGRWSRAIEVPGLAALNRAAGEEYGAEVESVSCSSAGNCAAGGYYSTQPAADRLRQQAFVVSEQNGHWQMAIEVPGTAALNAGHYAEGMAIGIILLGLILILTAILTAIQLGGDRASARPWRH
ncbi:MAG: hypothetical protein LBV34_14135, partial [Nocardiopsaceae bacterium]|nr:hypothetical protein [Nocardiopsaceae bacterium]